MLWISPGGESCDDIELAKQVADDRVGLAFRAEMFDLRHRSCQRALDAADGVFGIVLTLLFEAALALDELFSIEIGQGMKNGIAMRPRIGQEA